MGCNPGRSPGSIGRLASLVEGIPAVQPECQSCGEAAERAQLLLPFSYKTDKWHKWEFRRSVRHRGGTSSIPSFRGKGKKRQAVAAKARTKACSLLSTTSFLSSPPPPFPDAGFTWRGSAAERAIKCRSTVAVGIPVCIFSTGAFNKIALSRF